MVTVPEVTVGDYQFLPFDEAVSPPAAGVFRHYVNMWWAVHPEHGLAFFNPGLSDGVPRFRRGAAQCNASELMRSDSGVFRRMPWAEVRRLPSVWVEVSP